MKTLSYSGRAFLPVAALFFALLASSVAHAGGPSPAVDEVQPASMRRGSSTRVVASGSDLNGVSGVTVSGERIAIDALDVSGGTVSFDLTVGNRALAGPRDLIFSFTGTGDLTVTDAITVLPGEGVVFALTPASAVRGDGPVSVSLQGLNLDNVSDITLSDPEVVTSGYEADAADPTRASVTIRPRVRALAGSHDVTTVPLTGASTVLRDGFTVVPSALEVTEVSPNEAERGETVSVTISGRNLDLVDDVSFGSGVTIESVSVTDPTELVVSITARRDASPAETARNVAFATSEGESVTLEGAFTVRAGTPTISRVRPNRLSQGSVADLQIEGENLDGVDTFTAGEGVEVSTIDALSPVSVRVGVAVDDEATIGLRTLQLEGTYGTARATDGLQILERIELPVTLNYPDVQDLQTVEVGARKRANLLFRNGLETPENVTLSIVGGDITDFRFIDPEGGTIETYATDSLSFTLQGAAERLIVVEFRPSLPARSSASVDIEARGEIVGGLTLRGTGAPSVLRFNPPPPITIPPVSADEVGFQQLNTLSETAARVTIEGLEVIVERNDSPFPDAAERTTLTRSEPLPPETEYLFGVTLLTMETDYPAGTYEGELLVRTSRATAPILPVRFFTTVTPGQGGGDAGADMGPDAGSDMGGDMADDTGVEPDRPRGLDLGDTGGSEDTSTGGGAETVDTPGDDGCTVAGGAGVAGASNALLWLAMLGLSRRRRRSA